MNRKQIARLYHKENARGKPAPCFSPDFSEDNKLYEQIDSLNEISVMESKSHLKCICQVRMQEIPVNNPLSQLDDETIMDNIIPSSVPTNELLGMAHKFEYEIMHPKEDKVDNKTD